MGVISAYLPTEQAWRQRAPVWARDLWPVLRLEMEAWCNANKVQFFIDESARVY